MKVYLASPKFNSHQSEVVESVEKLLTELDINNYSPFRDAGKLNPDAGEKAREVVFKSNVESIDDCDTMISVIDSRDTGTIFEIGYFYGREKCKGVNCPPIIMYLSEPKEDISVMLTQAGYRLCIGLDELRDALLNLKSGGISNVSRCSESFRNSITH